MSELIKIKEFDYIPIPVGFLFFAGIEKADLAKLIASCQNESEKQDIINARKAAGDFFTHARISTFLATKILIREGLDAYYRGVRAPWAIYAYQMSKRKTFGCIKYPLIIIVILGLLYLLFK
jgi:hypothetical protein